MKKDWQGWNSYLSSKGLPAFQRWIGFFVANFPIEMKQIDSNTIESAMWQRTGATIKRIYKNGKIIQTIDGDGIPSELKSDWDDQNTFLEIKCDSLDGKVHTAVTYDLEPDSQLLREEVTNVDRKVSMVNIYKRVDKATYSPSFLTRCFAISPAGFLIAITLCPLIILATCWRLLKG